MLSYPVSKTISTPSVTAPKCRLWICDVSGSMTGYISAMTQDIIRQLDNCQAGDVLTVLWYSSEGLRGTIVKGIVVGENKAIIAKLLQQQMYARNLTCFSESLQDSVQHIADLSAFGYPWSLFWFTDGYPVVSNYTREVDAVYRALAQLQPLISDATIVGYGDYYNRELLARMAKALGANLVHADDLTAFSTGMQEHIGNVSLPRVKLTLQTDHELVFGLGTGKIVIYPVTKQEAWVSPVEVEVYGVGGAVESNISDVAAHYAQAYITGLAGNLDRAIEILGRQIGDVYLVNRLSSAFTHAEIGTVLAEIEQAALRTDKRFLEGKKKNCTPVRDAFCLIQALEILERDPAARFHPDAGFTYRRIGPETKAVADAPKFTRHPDQASPIKLTWHGTRLNVSIQAMYQGEVETDAEAVWHGLSNPNPALQYRNYTIIKDGVLHTRKLPVSISYTTFLAFQGGGLIKKTEHWQDKVDCIYVLDLARIPVMNRAMADSVKATDMADLTLVELEAQANLKVLKYLRDLLDPQKEQVVSQYNPDQQAYLAKFHVDYRGWYTPPVEKAEPTDWYDAKTFEIKVKGASSLPSVKEVLERVATGKKLNAVAEMLYAAYAVYKDKTLEEIDAAISSNKLTLADVRRDLNRARCAIILGQRWLPEFKNRDENKLNHEGFEFTFALGSEKVAY